MAKRSKRRKPFRESAKMFQDARYLDHDFLPHTPFGDLAHLRDDRNTGAARKDLEEVCRWPLLSTI